MQENRVNINGVLIYPFKSVEQIIMHVTSHKGLLIAINAGKIYRATDQTRKLINLNIGYLDGAGALKAVKSKGCKDAVKIPGCELWLEIIKRTFQNGSSYYFIGGKQEVINDTVRLLQVQFPGIHIAGYRNGYIQEKDKKLLISDVAKTKPDFVFIAMGSPKQELLMQEMYDVYPAVCQGLGGSFDVYTGRATRAPKWFRNHNLEGFYRLITDVNATRLKRYWDDIKFMMNLYRGKY